MKRNNEFLYNALGLILFFAILCIGLYLFFVQPHILASLLEKLFFLMPH